MDLPAEILTQIFDLAADEDVIFQYGLPTVMAESAWFKNIAKDWTLQSPGDTLNLIQRRSYATKKAIILTCKCWRALGSEFLFRCLYFNNPSKLLALCAILDPSASSATTLIASFGWWTRRIHLSRYCASAATNTTLLELENALASIIRHCPNLEIFIVDWPMGESFGAIANALATYPCRRSLRTVHWAVGSDSVAKVIWAFDCLPYVVALHIEFEAPPGTEDYDLSTPPLGSASGLRLSLPRLQQLSLHGHAKEFIDQATSWSLPSLRSFSLTSTTTGIPLPDIPLFLTHHSSQLLFLDINTLSMPDLPIILDLCPSLDTLLPTQTDVSDLQQN